MSVKAQVGLEYMFIFAFSLVAVGMLWTYSTLNIENTKWDLQLATAKSSLDIMTEIVDTTYVQGPPSQVYVYPNFPDNMQNVYVANNSITIELLWKGDTLRNLSATSIANITGNISTAPGTHKILVKAIGTYVQITEA